MLQRCLKVGQMISASWLFPELRKARILQRDSITEEAAQARMDAQLPEQFFVEHSDFIIKNNKDCRNLEVVSEEVIAKIKEYYIRRYQVPS